MLSQSSCIYELKSSSNVRAFQSFPVFDLRETEESSERSAFALPQCKSTVSCRLQGQSVYHCFIRAKVVHELSNLPTVEVCSSGIFFSVPNQKPRQSQKAICGGSKRLKANPFVLSMPSMSFSDATALSSLAHGWHMPVAQVEIRYPEQLGGRLNSKHLQTCGLVWIPIMDYDNPGISRI